jgi:ral guanine nucleotide dissociation stimulator
LVSLYSKDFYQPPDFADLKVVIAYLQRNMPASDVECRARLLLSQWEPLEPRKAEAEGEEPGTGT